MEDGDDYLVVDEKDGEAICPYNPDHKLRKSRLQYHMLKCEKQFTGEVYQCPYNATHRMRIELKEDHMKTCEHRIIEQREQASVPPQQQFKFADEEWDEPAPIPVVQAPVAVAVAAAPSNHFFPDVKGKTAAQKKKIYADLEREFKRNQPPAEPFPEDLTGSRSSMASSLSFASSASTFGQTSRITGIGRGRPNASIVHHSYHSQVTTPIGGSSVFSVGQVEEEQQHAYVANDLNMPPSLRTSVNSIHFPPEDVPPERTNRYGYYQPE